MMNSNPEMNGHGYKIFDEPESRNEGACLRYMMNPELPNEGRVLRYVMNPNPEMRGHV